jgi:hypothetical protein
MNLRVACTFLFTAIVASTCTAERYHVADASKIVSPSDPEISPDGKSIALVVTRVNLDEDRRDAEILLVDIARRWIQWLGRYLPTDPGAEAAPPPSAPAPAASNTQH